jgi:hypothetical protein
MFGKKKSGDASPKSSILVITGDLNMNYQIIDSVFAIDNHKGGWIMGADPGVAFTGVREQLRKKAKKVGGNAVINCIFEYRVAVQQGIIGSSQVMEIFAYGTVVRTV